MAAIQVAHQVAVPQFRSNDGLTPALRAAPDIRELLAGQKVSGLNELFSHYYIFVFRFCSRITETASEAEDAAQDTFLRAYSSIHQFHGNSKFSTWLGRIAMNCALEITTRKKKVDALSVALMNMGDDLPDNFESEDPNPEQMVINSELGLILQKTIQGLDAGYRVVCVLRDVEGLSTAETAETLGLSEPAVKSRLERGRRILRERLHKYVH